MEKNKGLFSFRKHPVGDFLDEKKGRKRKGGRLRRSMGFLMAAALIFNTLPASGLAVSASGREAGLCEQHTEHTLDCGYREAQPCTHEHGEECYTTVTECVHEHTDECYPEVEETEESTGEGDATTSDAGNREPLLCTHVCSEESGCITKVLDCHHEHGESCGYQEAQDCGYACEICNGTEPEDTGENTEDTGTDTAKCICETLCTEDSINGDCPVCGADDASLLDCKGKVLEENTENQEDTGICKHHQEHDADCGYIPKSENGEGSPCTYECRICPIEVLIAALPEQVTEDNADDVRAQLDHILDLYRELDEGEQEEIDLSRIYALQGALDAANAPMTADGSTEQQATDEASVTINGETLYYATLEEAFAAANRQTATITMLTDAECIKSDSAGSPLNITGGNVTLNLNGNALSGRGYGGYGIIDVSGGSLLVQGEESKVKVARRGLSCRGNGKLTVEGITLELVGDDEFFAGAGILNVGGTVTLNGTQMTGAASDGQIYHYSGTTTINNVTATGVTENCPKSVWYHNEGTLTINGGTFDKIVVESDNYGGVQSVAELLGEGYAYKKQEGTWATADDLAAMEISNVTVKKIPLTINPQGDTSWYYSAQQTHTLAMNAAPVNGSDSVAYVWKNGNEMLDCTSDAYTVPAGTPVGSYTYTCEATCDGYTLSHTFTFKIEQSGTEFTGGIKTYNGSEETTSFSADDTITVKAAPTATGTAPQKAAARLWADPAAGQMALFVGDVQVSEPVSAGEGGTYTMTVSAAKVLLQGNTEPNGNAITLTAKFVGNDNMADGAGTVKVNITAVAKAEKGGAVIGYYGESNLNAAFADSGNAGATITLLSDVEPSTYLTIQIDCTLDLGGHTITSPMGKSQCVNVQTNTTVTIRGEGEIIAPSGIALAVDGSVALEGGTYTSGGSEFPSVYVVGQSAMLSVTGEKVSIRNTSGGYGLIVAQAQSVRLSAGTYSGTAGAISSTVNLSDMLAHTGNIRYAYYQGDALVTTGLDGQALTGIVTVKACTHAYQYAHTTGTTTHSQTCPVCGDAKTAETCSYDAETGRCACGSTLAVTLSGAVGLVYNGSPHTPDVTVTLDGTELTAGTDYTVTYADNVNAGTDTATVTVTGKGSYSFEIKKTFSIEKAEQENFAVVAETKPYEKNGTFTLSTTGGGGDGAVLYRVPENNGVLIVNGGKATIIGAGTVTVTATKAESDNYKAAAATGNITIKKASAPAITYPTAGSITYGQRLSDCTLTGGSTEYGTFAWKDASTVPAVGDTTSYAVVFTASEETKKNYETIINTTQNVPVKVEKAVPAVSITAAVSGSKDHRQAVITVNVAKAGAGVFPTGMVTFIDCTGSTEVEIGTVTLSNGTASYTWEGLLNQEYTIKVVYVGGGNYKEAESREFTFDAAKQNQQDFALDAIGAKTYGDATVTLKTTGGSGSGAVRYESSDEDVIRIEDGRAIITGAGTATITAIKERDDNYNEASASRNVTVAKKALTVKADSKTVVRGNPMPILTYRAEGLVNGDAFTTAPSITAGAQNTDSLGKYDIVISGGTLRNSESYSITYVNGTLNIVERFYTVTVTDGTGGGEYAEGDTVTVTANERNGYTFTGWSSEDGVAFADSKAKNTTFIMPAKSVTVKANYTRNSSSGNGSTNPGNGNTTPQPSVTQPTDTNTSPGNETAPGTGTTPVNPGSGNTVKPGTAPGSGTGTPAQGTKQPFIKGADGKIGWDVIRAEEEQAQEGSTINVDMNGSVVVPGDIFDSIKGKDITITFDMGNGILWSVDGKSITMDKAGDIDFSVQTGVNTVPVNIVNNVTGKNYSIQISLAHDGEFGFAAVLSIGLGKENAGYMANLYYYNESTRELEFICADTVAEDGTVSLAFTHASDYVIVINEDGEEESGNAVESAQPENQNADSSGQAEESPQTMPAWRSWRPWRPWWLIVVGALVIIMGVGVFFFLKKGKDGDSGQ